MNDPYTALMPDNLRVRSVPRHRTWFRDGRTSVYVDRWGDPNASRRTLFLHGMGGHSGLLAPFAAAVAHQGVHVIVPDLPGFGRTRVPDRAGVRYPHWVETACALARAEQEEFGARIALVGASVGGMLAYDVATRTEAAHTVVATCLLDPRQSAVLRHISHRPWLGALAPRAARLSAGPFANVSLPVRMLSNMGAISNQPELTRAVLRDRSGGGNKVPLGFLRSYLETGPLVEPEHAHGFTLVLAHPERDRWTPVEVSSLFFDRVAAPKELVMLPNAGHLPVEEPGLGRLIETIVEASTPA
ncbi:alpha/beta hydrolase [Nocardiopsis alkaliphila]|uniref:alpha/beta hydrolase n=1 Tax=Nocardiopsis alkaliphila TaxID=225762 RepID=UPI000348F1F1|nr:alpha/beta hydrolase [Nocardiopsis alkaliphila]